MDISGTTVDLDTLKGVSFLVIYLFWAHICTIWAWKWLYFPIFVMLHHCWCLSWCHCDVDSLANAPQCSRHPREGSVEVSAQSDWWCLRYSHFCTPPVILIWQHSIFWTMLVPTSSASMPATPVPLSTYDWNVADQMWEFCLFKCQRETWFQLCKIKAEECLDYLLCILGKEGYAAKDCWVPLDEGHKWDPKKFLNYI